MKKHEMIITIAIALLCLALCVADATAAVPSQSAANTADTPHIHQMSEWTVTVTPTCKTNGCEQRRCTVCNYTEEREVKQMPHRYDMEVVWPSCEKEGYTAFICLACGKTRQGDTWQPLGHRFAEEVTAPACEEDGYTTFTCVLCNKTRAGNTIPATGHQWGKWEHESDPTCTGHGYEERSCRNCVMREARTIMPAGHQFLFVEKEATEEQSGYSGYICTCCDETFLMKQSAALGQHEDKEAV